MGTVKKVYRIKADAASVFAALTDAKHIREWSGDTVKMGKKAGTLFSLWGGSIHGKNIEISPERIIQDWKEEAWEEFSRVTFHIRTKGKQTELELIHEGIPEKSVKSIDSGWDDYYLGPLRDYVEENLAGA